jgi:hypothetical protein
MPYTPTKPDNPIPPMQRSVVTQLTWKDYVTIIGAVIGLATGAWKAADWLFYTNLKAVEFTTQVKGFQGRTAGSFKLLLEDYRKLKGRVGRLQARVQRLEIDNAVLKDRSTKAAPAAVTVGVATPTASHAHDKSDKSDEGDRLNLPIFQKK